MGKQGVIETMISITELLREAQIAGGAAYWWSQHKDWANNIAGAEWYGRLAYKLGSKAVELWESQQIDIQNT